MIRNVLTTSSRSNTQPCVFTHADNPWLSSPVKTNRFNSSAGLDAWLITGEEISLLFPPAPLQQLPVQGCSSHQAPPHILGGASPAAGRLAAVKAGIWEGTNPPSNQC